MDDLKLEDCINKTCPWSGEPVSADSLTTWEGHIVGFCNPGCRDKFEKAAKHFERSRVRRDTNPA
ncbi:MAG: glutathione S-transferase [Pseudomonadota bacterium]